jgi:hypothetical protein
MFNIKVISLSLGGELVSGLDAGSMAMTENMVDSARRDGINVVAAAGNHGGAVDWPAGYGPVVAVGAADSEGARCSFAASGPELDLSAQGCPMDAAFPDGTAAWTYGTSESAAFVAAVLTQLRQLRPDLTAVQAEQALTSNTRAGRAGPLLDVAAVAEAVGLADRLSAGRLGRPSLQDGSDTVRPHSALSPDAIGTSRSEQQAETVVQRGVTVPVSMPQRRRLPKPAISSMHVRHGVLKLTLSNRPKEVEARVQVFVRRQRQSLPTLVRALRLTDDRLRASILGTLSQVSITYRDPSGARDVSTALVVNPRKAPAH